MRVSRFFWFLVSILLGVTAGLGIAWYLRPASMGEASPATLRSDYRTDYVLMVAEIFNADKDLTKAEQRLTFLGNDPAAHLVQVAVIRAGELGYDRRDLELMARLAQVLEAPEGTPVPTTAPSNTATPSAAATTGANP